MLRVPWGKKFLVAPSWAVPYVVPELLCQAKEFEWIRNPDRDPILRIINEHGRCQLSRTNPPQTEATAAESDGWVLFVWCGDG